MSVKKSAITKGLFTLIIITFIAASAILFMAQRNISSDDPQILVASQKISKALIMRILDRIESIFGDTSYAPTPFDSADFSYADLSHPYFEKIRNDKRVAHFYVNGTDPIDVADAIAMREYLRDLFPHGAASTSFINTNVLEMIDAAEQGEKFLCGNISKMLVQLIQAGGTQARTVGLQAKHSGHVVVELWSKQFNKWVTLDPDYNVHYTDTTGEPLSALEIFEMSQDSKKINNIKPVKGKSSNTLYKSDSRLVDLFYKNGVAINFYNRWVDKNYPRRHPARSPSIMAFYVGDSTVDKLYYKHDSQNVENQVLEKLYSNPAEYSFADQ